MTKEEQIAFLKEVSANMKKNIAKLDALLIESGLATEEDIKEMKLKALNEYTRRLDDGDFND